MFLQTNEQNLIEQQYCLKELIFYKLFHYHYFVKNNRNGYKY
jgi:hypothetical protein